MSKLLFTQVRLAALLWLGIGALACARLSDEQKVRIANAAQECRASITGLKLEDSYFSEHKLDVNEEFPADLENSAMRNAERYLDAFNRSGGNFAVAGQAARTPEDTRAARARQIELIKLRNDLSSRIGDTLTRCYAGSILPILKRAGDPKDWRITTQEYHLLQRSTMLIGLSTSVRKTAEVRDDVNSAIAKTGAFLDRVAAKTRG
jgi:hypothetical protein